MSCKNHLKLENSNTTSWLKIRVDSIFIEQPVLSSKIEKSGKIGVYIHLFLPCKNSNSLNMTQ